MLEGCVQVPPAVPLWGYGEVSDPYERNQAWEVMGSDMPPDGRCLPRVFPVYSWLLDALHAGPHLWGERGMKRDLLSPCQPHPSMIADLLTDGENLSGDFPSSV